ncbi:MAG: thiol-disulfide oxidoreductase [Pseudomonadota bacterium]
MRVYSPEWISTANQRLRSGDSAVKASDGLSTFSVMWALALIFSVISHFHTFTFRAGIGVGILNYTVLIWCAALILQPRRLVLLVGLAATMAAQYVWRLPVASNNQTIAFFMNLAIVAVAGVALLRNQPIEAARDEIYERLRIVARLLLAVMYFYGIFHKINTDFLDPNASCAVALYTKLTQAFGLGDSLIGRYGSIVSTFVVEGIAIYCLFKRQYFAIGLIIALVFHYIIPISAYSWYMDFSSLVFALYALSIPREVSIAFYQKGAKLLKRFPSSSAGGMAIIALTALLFVAVLTATGLREQHGDLVISDKMMWHSAWIMIWAVVGGVIMVLLTIAALDALPYRPQPALPIPRWIYAFPAVLFIACLSPYLGLKTESSIAMFSNLHTEGAASNHLLIPHPPYVADYQRDVAMITGSSSPRMQTFANRELGMVRYHLERWIEQNPDKWVSFTMNGKHFERVSTANYAVEPANWLERKLLIFKPVDLSRPKVCTH